MFDLHAENGYDSKTPVDERKRKTDVKRYNSDLKRKRETDVKNSDLTREKSAILT